MFLRAYVRLLFVSIVVMLPYFAYSVKQGLIGVLILFVCGLISKYLFVLISILSVIINIFYFHIMIHWGVNAIGSRIQAALESPAYERLEYLKAYINIYDGLILIYVLMVSVLIILFLKYQNKETTDRIMIALSVPILLIILVIPANPSTVKTLQLIQLPLLTYRAQERLSTINIRKEYLESIHFKKLDCSNIYDKVIIIQGEAVNKNHMEIYGYKKNTTPFLSSIDLRKFKAISPTNQTRYSIPIEFTDATAQNYQMFFHSKSIVTSLRECGYSTYWVSNQGRRGHHDTSVTSIANEAEYTFFLNELDYQSAQYDGKILDILKTISNKNEKKQAIFIHLIGSHIAYKKRYPIDKAFIKSESVVDLYDNSIHYTDYILSKINDIFLNDSSLFIYLSDHGEVVSNDRHGHGYFPGFTDEYEIPLIIWGDNENRVVNLEKKSNGKTINTESFNHIVEYLVGINDDLNVSYSQKIFSLKPDNVLDYNELLLYNNIK